MRQVLVAADGSEGADRAIDFAAEVVSATGDKLHILNVASGLAADIPEAVHRSPSTEKLVGEIIDEQAHQILTRAMERARKKGALDIESHFFWGDPAEEILEAARKLNSDVVVVGRRGRGRLSGLLLGSVSQKLASLAPCTVVIVP